MYEGTIFGNLHQKLQHAIADAGYKIPTPIQEKAMPLVLGGRDLIGCAQTGTGKTAAFALPILNRLINVRKPRHIGHPRAVVLSPTRELAVQTAENLKVYSKYCQLPFACVIGGVSQFSQVKDIKRGAETLVACPGRLIDLMTQGIIYLDEVEMFVLDEADRMLDMGFLPDVKRIISKLPKKRQSMFFSATMGEEVMRLAGVLVQDPAEVRIDPGTPAVEKINQSAMLVDKGQKDSLLLHILSQHPEWSKVIVFTKMRHGADRVNKKLMRADIASAAIHSDKTQGQRTRALDGFKSGKLRVLVATDIASRGIDVPDVDCVVNMELPLEPESYVHRIGRTARAGSSGAAISFVTPQERGQLKAVERFIKRTIRIDDDHPYHAGPDAREAEPWEREALVPPEDRRKKNRKGRGHRKGEKIHRPSSLGRRQPDFRQKRNDDL